MVVTWFWWSSARRTPRLLHCSFGCTDKSRAAATFGSSGGALVSHQQADSVVSGSCHCRRVELRSARIPCRSSTSVVSQRPPNQEIDTHRRGWRLRSPRRCQVACQQTHRLAAGCELCSGAARRSERASIGTSKASTPPAGKDRQCSSTGPL